MATLCLKKPSPRFEKQKQQPPERVTTSAARRYLCAEYPDLFSRSSPRPLAIGIHKQLRLLLPDWLPMNAVRRFLSVWTIRRAYLEALARGGPRHGVNGIAGSVTAEQVESAVSKLTTTD